ncbi:MAG: NADH-quinone oxidoreductase subunit I [Hydrogenothermaceae bacterium]|nr:NADH-quinone oxidoreductase subunit I [Hydrogenothermaceae bacterium]
MIKVKFLERPNLNLWEKVFFLDFINGLKVTFKNLLRKTITTKYPYEKLTPPKRFRGVHAHRVKDGQEPPSFAVLGKFMEINYDESRCVACYMCQQACPMPTLFKIEAVQLPNGKKRVTKFEMNLLNCLYCGLCVDACPVDCLIMTDIYESANYHRKNCVIHMEDMSDRGRDFDRRRKQEKDRIWIDDQERTKLWGQIRWT